MQPFAECSLLHSPEFGAVSHLKAAREKKLCRCERTHDLDLAV